MDWGYVLDFIYEFAYFLGVLGLFLVFAVFKGRQAIINVIFGLYLALLFSTFFPYYETLLSDLGSSHSIAAAKLFLFALITIGTTIICWRVMPDEFQEERFESLGKKTLLALGASVLVMIFSFNILPVTEFLAPDTPLQTLFGQEQHFFWWLLTPLVLLYFV